MANNLRPLLRQYRAERFRLRVEAILAHQYPLNHCFQCGQPTEPEQYEFFYDHQGQLIGGRTRNIHFCFWRSRIDQSWLRFW